MEPLEKLDVRGLTVELHRDDDCLNPREDWDEACIMVCAHRRYQLGDKREWVESRADKDNPRTWLWTELGYFTEFLEEHPGTVYVPLYLYDHGGITMSTGAFGDPWDSGQVGWAYMTPEMITWEYGNKGALELTLEMVEKARALIKSEVRVYDQYLRGECYGYVVRDPETSEVLDSCWGFLGDEKYALEEGQLVAEAIADAREERAAQVRAENIMVPVWEGVGAYA